jgi:hypothetical protein
MTPKRAGCVLAALAVIGVAGCGSGGSSKTDMSSQASDDTSTTTRSTAPSQAFGPTHTEGVIEKKIGEPAGLNCPDDPKLPCDLNFTVTAIAQGVSCDAGAEPLEPDQQFLRFDTEAFSSQQTFALPNSADALLLANWSVDGVDGTVHDLISYSECGEGEAPVGKPVATGDRVRARIVVRAPKPAVRLRLSWLQLMWEWPVPGAD